jgi:hypothetical protein
MLSITITVGVLLTYRCDILVLFITFMLQDILRLPRLQEIHDEWRFTEGNCQL